MHIMVTVMVTVTVTVMVHVFTCGKRRVED
jgi:hypothetical protein